jgi:hypothetical protein
MICHGTLLVVPGGCAIMALYWLLALPGCCVGYTHALSFTGTALAGRVGKLITGAALALYVLWCFPGPVLALYILWLLPWCCACIILS